MKKVQFLKKTQVMKTLLTAIVLMVAMNAVSQEDQHLEGQVKDREMNGIDKVSELVAGSVLAVEVYPNPSGNKVSECWIPSF